MTYSDQPSTERDAKIKWQIGWLLFAGTALNYVARTNVAFLLAPISQDFGLTEVQEGYLLSIFFLGYIVFNPVGGWCADRFGARVVLGLSFVVCALGTAASAGVWSLSALLALRILVGAASGPVFPACAQVVACWFPRGERGRATALFDVGSYIGSALTGPLVVGSALLVGWRGALLVSAAILFIWPIGWFLVYGSSDDRRVMGSPDIESLPHRLAKFAHPPARPNLWGQLLRERKVWGMAYGFFCYNYVKVFYLSWFPTFLLKEKAFPLSTVALVSVLPPLSAVVGEFTAGWATDRLLHHGVPLTPARKIPLCLGLLLSSVVILAGFTVSHFWTMVWLAIGYASLIGATPGIWTIPGEVSPGPNTVGQLGGLQNAFASIGSLVAPVITGYLWRHYSSFFPALLLSGVLAASGALAYWFVVGKLEPLTLQRRAH